MYLIFFFVSVFAYMHVRAPGTWMVPAEMQRSEAAPDLADPDLQMAVSHHVGAGN